MLPERDDYVLAKFAAPAKKVRASLDRTAEGGCPHMCTSALNNSSAVAKAKLVN
jgi:hypothetical protein